MPRAKKVEGSPSTKAKLKIGDLRKVDPLNESQKKFFDFYNDASKQIIMAHGVAGTGKTYIAMYKALGSVLNKEFEKVLIIRSAVQSREIGHLPGDLEEKLEQILVYNLTHFLQRERIFLKALCCLRMTLNLF